MRASNIERQTSNFEVKKSLLASTFDVQRWALAFRPVLAPELACSVVKNRNTIKEIH
jgi:hypothetical protein